jgi:hypothetical protein
MLITQTTSTSLQTQFYEARGGIACDPQANTVVVTDCHFERNAYVLFVHVAIVEE